ncbi:hypothetical protein [Brucella gallinifaecis]|uniref:hypothetical protein n=1 Tax=Brucella gallinifaecis TaxID=215590 RepID=UPI002361BA11|nr:hypothetical protein [Brucella gallinifaecis]
MTSVVFGFGFGVGIYLCAGSAQSNKSLHTELASLTKGLAVMQPLPAIPSEPMPKISSQQELIIPDNAPNVHGIDPIITGPRAYKPRAEIRSTASKGS